MFENESVDFKIQNKRTEYKIFELNLSNAWKYDQVKLVLAVFASICLLKVIIKLY